VQKVFEAATRVMGWTMRALKLMVEVQRNNPMLDID
jgi:hypothetical protein